MATISFDTLAFVKQLKSVGYADSQAEAQAQTINKALSDFQNSRLNEFATRADLKTEITKAKVEIIKWVTGMLVAQAAIVATLVKRL